MSAFARVVTVACVSALSECGQLAWIEPSPCTKHVTRGCGFVPHSELLLSNCFVCVCLCVLQLHW